MKHQIKIALYRVCLIPGLLFLTSCQTPPPLPALTVPVLDVAETERGVQIFLPSAVLFETGKADLNANEAMPYIERVAFLLNNKTQNPVAIEGHADTNGTDAINVPLSQNRAKVVMQALQKLAVAPQRMTSEGFSSRRPVASNATEEGRKLNRRVEIVILDEKLANITRGERADAFASAWEKHKAFAQKQIPSPSPAAPKPAQ